MIQLVYLSSTKPPLSPADIAQILASSRKNNSRRGVTGLLLYKEGSVLQILEGEADAVHQLFAIIELDRRHQNVIRMFEKTIIERDFPEWTMGFQDLNDEGARYLDGYSAALSRNFDMRTIKPSQAKILLTAFKVGFR